MKKLKSKKNKIVKHVTKVTENSLGQTVTKRLEQAVSCRNIEALFKNFGLLRSLSNVAKIKWQEDSP